MTDGTDDVDLRPRVPFPSSVTLARERTSDGRAVAAAGKRIFPPEPSRLDDAFGHRCDAGDRVGLGWALRLPCDGTDAERDALLEEGSARFLGDIVPVTTAGRWVTIAGLIVGIVLIPWQASRIIKEWTARDKVNVKCPNCGLSYHDPDASHCKACGHVIYQEYDSRG